MLEGSSIGLSYIFSFEWKYVFDLTVWYKAAAQVLFQLSLGKSIPLSCLLLN